MRLGMQLSLSEIPLPPRMDAARWQPAKTWKTLDDRLAKIKEIGFNAIEIGGETQIIRKATSKLLENRITIAGIGAYFFNPCHPDEKTRRQFYEQAVETIKLSSELKDRPPLFIGAGSRSVVGSGWVPHKDNYTDWAFKMSVKGLKELCKVAEDYNIVLGLEVGVSTVAYSGKRCAQLIDEVGSEKLKMHMDACNFITFPFVYYNNTTFLNELFDDLHGKIIDGHLKDFVAEEGHNITTVMKHVPPGKGNMDWDTYLKRLDQEIGLKGYAIFEYVTLEELPEAMAFIKAKAKKLGITIQ